jgi:hypothetical protein
MRVYSTTPLPERFWPKVEKTDGCWLWTAARFTNGYGAFRVGNRQRKAHNVAWELTHGPIPQGRLVCHSCDVKRCVNPAHLFLGTQRDNIRDAMSKGRMRGGSHEGSFAVRKQLGQENVNARFTERDVRDIRGRYAEGVSGMLLAAEYGVSHQSLYSILNRKTWRHVP